jgi:transaldolase
MPSRAQQLLELGQSIWLDFIRRGHLLSGEFDRDVRDYGVVGVTSNPTIFQQAIAGTPGGAGSGDYDAAIAEGMARGLEGEPLFESLAIEDIRMACDKLRPVFDRSLGMDGRVSLEVSPRLARDTAYTIAAAQRLHAAAARPNVMIKIPATREGLPAITAGLAAGISINVTLIFTLARYREVMDAWLTGLEQRLAKAGDLSALRSVASFFVSRVDTKIDGAIERRLASLPEGATERAELESLRGKAAIANARLAYAEFESVIAGSRFQKLHQRGAHRQRPLWASTSTKNKAYRDVLYVEELIGPDTVNTVPPATLAAFNDHGKVESRIGHDVPGARAVIERLTALGVPAESLIGELEGEGVQAFAKSFDDLLGALETRRRELLAQRGQAR